MKKYRMSIFFMVISLWGYGQTQVSIDTTTIRIGEQVTYTISTDEAKDIAFPELKLQSSGAIELVKDLPVDTIKNRLYKKYLLTSFDSGVHVIPQQTININGIDQLLDSLLIEVKTVKVDTTQQGLHPIKNIYKAPPKTWRDFIKYFWWILGLGLIVGLVWWWLKHKKDKENSDPELQHTPYEWANMQLQKLDQSNLLLNNKIKTYYSELTDIVRNYLEKDFHVQAMEQTTDELILKLKAESRVQSYKIKPELLEQLSQFLQSADMVKFAKAKPIDINIREDRRFAMFFIDELYKIIEQKKAKEAEAALHNPNSEVMIQKRQQQKRQWIIGISSLVGFLLVFGLWQKFGGQNLFGNTNKQLLDKTWFTSNYGYPSVKLYAPFVLNTVNADLPEHISQQLVSHANFEYGKPEDKFYLGISTLEFTPQAKVDLTTAIQNAVETIKNTENIEDLDYQITETVISGNEGQLLKGTYKYKGKTRDFYQYFIPVKNSIVTLVMTYNSKDKYAESIDKKIMEAITIENQNL